MLKFPLLNDASCYSIQIHYRQRRLATEITKRKTAQQNSFHGTKTISLCLHPVFCWRHFEEADVVKGRLIGKVFHPKERRRLKEGFIPRHFLGK